MRLAPEDLNVIRSWRPKRESVVSGIAVAVVSLATIAKELELGIVVPFRARRAHPHADAVTFAQSGSARACSRLRRISMRDARDAAME